MELQSRRKQITADDALSAPSKFEISRELLRDGQNEISIVREQWHWPTLLFGGGRVLQSRRASDACRQRDLRAAAVFQTRESSDVAEGIRL